MKKIKFTCPSCDAKLRVPTHLAGVSAPCPKCGHTITAPTDLENIVDESPRSVSASRTSVASLSSPSRKNPNVSPATTMVAEAPSAPREPASSPVPRVSARVAPEPTRESPLPPPPPALEETHVPQEIHVVEETILIPPPAPVQAEAISLPDPSEPIGPPATPKTEPIRINREPSILPPPRAETASEGPGLPRLDVDLASTAEDAPHSAARRTTRIDLSAPNAGVPAATPEDFVIAPAPAASAPAPPPAEFDSVSSVDFDFSETEVAETSSGVPIDQIDFPEPTASTPASEMPAYVPLELPPMDGNFSPEEGLGEEYEYGELGDGSMGELLAQQAPGETYDGADAHVSAEPTLQHDWQTWDAAPSHQQPADEPTAELPVHPMPGVVAPSPAGAGVKSDQDVLDEMFGPSKERPEKSKRSTVILLSVLGATAIAAVVLVFVVVSFAGGWKPQDSYVEGATQASAASAPSPAENTKEDADPLTSSDNPPESIEIPEDGPLPDSTTGSPSRSTTTLPGDMANPVRIVDGSSPSSSTAPNSAPAEEDPVTDTPAEDRPALSIDERVQEMINGSTETGSNLSVIGGEPSIDPVQSALDSFSASTTPETSPTDEEARPKTSANYNPPASFDAPSPDDGPLGKTHDLLDAFLRAPDWETRVKYCYQGESLRPAMEEYYKKWEMKTYDRFSRQLFQMEQDETMGGPYWVYLVSTSDTDQGFPVIVRVEEGKLKVDWEIYSEFEDRHFAKFREGAIASPHTFRLVAERMSDYYGPDKDTFADIGNYLVYQVNPPYGNLNEFSEYAFVEKDSETARQLDAVVGLSDDPLAVIITLEQRTMAHGTKHFIVTDYVTEGWFR